jgi:ketosteroid isomerase-like protein
MSQRNVEGVCAALALYQDPEGVARLASGDLDLTLVTFDVEWDASRLDELIPDLAGVYHGHDGVRTYWRRWLDAWRDLEYEVEDVIAAGDDVIALIRNQRQWGRTTGICTTLPPYSMVFGFRDGRVSRWRGYANQEDGLAAVGLRL